MILLSHPTGNTFVRALLSSLETDNGLHSFYTTILVQDSDWFLNFCPKNVKKELLRRRYDFTTKANTHPFLELIRLLASKFRINFLTAHEVGWASIDAIYTDFDLYVSRRLPNASKLKTLSGVYCYEDAALQTFTAAKQMNLACIYDLPIAYWQTGNQLLSEEAERLPEWEPTLPSNTVIEYPRLTFSSPCKMVSSNLSCRKTPTMNPRKSPP